MYTWCEADWYNGPSCGSSALCQINITYPCHYNLVSPSLSSFFSPLYLILLTFLFIPKRGPRFRSVITGCFFSTPCSHYPLLLHGCPQEEPEGGAWQTGHEHRVEKDADVKAMNLGTLPPPRPSSLSLSLASAPCSGAGRSRVAPNQRSPASPKTITHSSTNQRKWGDKSTPGVCVCVVFNPSWHSQGHSEGFKEWAGGYNLPVTILSHGRRDFDGIHFIMACESKCAPLTLD